MKNFNILRNESSEDAGGGGGGGSSGGSASLLDTQASASQGEGSGATQGTQAEGAQGTGGSTNQAFDFRALIGDDGRFTPDFHQKLPDNLKEHAAHFSKYQTPLHALEHTLNLQQLLGKKADAVVIPGADASREEWAPVLAKLGVPDSLEGYNLKVPDKLPEGVQINEDELKHFAGVAHEIGLTPQQVAKLQEYDIARAQKAGEGFQQQALELERVEFEKQAKLLEKEFGTGPEAEKKQVLAERAALTFGFSPEDISGGNALFRNAQFVSMLAKVGAAMPEDSLVSGDNANTTGGMKAKAKDVINNPQNPLYKRYWDGDQDVQRQVQDWMRNG
jgi:hypothetical protein